MERLTEKRLEKIEELFRNPPPNSKIAEAREFGTDFTLLIENLRLTPQERIEKLQYSVKFLKSLKKQDKLKAEKSGKGFEAILLALLKNEVNFIIVGETACFVHGWENVFLKLEILYSPFAGKGKFAKNRFRTCEF